MMSMTNVAIIEVGLLANGKECGMTYKIEYSETFLNTYEVDADSFEEAKKILEEDIYYGRASEPWECVESHFEDVTDRGW